ncbi:MAG: hypothetical protein OXC54_04585 [Rhodospirillaceae bacterium]|nr:hypothetical protein [Rhodospirillaceae bacterium]
MIDSTTPFDGETATVCAALEVSGTRWILAVGDPSGARTGLHRLAPHDVDGLLAKLDQAREEGEDRPDRRAEDGAGAPGLVRRRPGRDVAGAGADGCGGGREAAAAQA